MTFKCTEDSLHEQAIGLLSNSTSGETIAIVENNLGCAMVATSPGTAKSSFRTCFPATGRCPGGHPLTMACESYTAVSEADNPFGGTVLFKNPHCLACNENGSIGHIDCLNYYPIFIRFWVDHPPAPISLGPPPISILFDFRSAGNVKVVSQQEVIREVPVACPALQVYDPSVSRCRQLTCAEGYTLVDDQCVKRPGMSRERGMVVYIHVTVCTKGSEGVLEPMETQIKTCLAGFGNFNQSQLQPSTMTPTRLASGDCAAQGRHRVYAFMIGMDLETFQKFHPKLLAIKGHTFCVRDDEVIPIASVEVIYHNASLSLSRCNGKWSNEFTIPNVPDRSNATDEDSPFDANLAIQRAKLRLQEPSGDLAWFYDFQLCQNPDLSCLLETFNRSSFLPDVDDKTVLIYIPTGVAFRRDMYIETAEGQIKVCSFNEQNGTRNHTEVFTFFRYSPAQQILSLIGNIASMLAAVVTLLTFCIFKELRHRTTGPIMNFIAALFVSQLFLLLSGSATTQRVVCTIIALAGHYFLLVSAMWTSVLAFNLKRTFAARSPVQRSRRSGVSLPSVLFAWGVPFLVALPCLVLHLCDCSDLPLWYGNANLCWVGNGLVSIVVVGVPIGMVVCANAVLFTCTVLGIRRTKRDTRVVQTNKSERQLIAEELIIYVKVS